MKTTKMSRAETVHKAALNAISGFSSNNYDIKTLDDIFANFFIFLGENNNERADNLPDLQQMLGVQRSRLRNSAKHGSLNCTPIFRSQSPNKDSAVYVDELHFQPSGEENLQNLVLRITCVLYKLEEGWRVTSLQISGSKTSDTRSSLPQKESEERNSEKKKLFEEQAEALLRSSEKLKAIQAQLLRQEKLASLGQLTAGIAHEIKNPLNFINNFSELSSEFLDEIEENLQKLEQNDTTEEIQFLLNDVKANLEKIHQHGTRADGIVKSMLLHSRGGSGKMEEIDLNALIKEYVNLSFHGMRANKNPINVDIQIETDANLGAVKINPENFSRVILNLCKNAFDAMREKLEQSNKNEYLPKLIVRTKIKGSKVLIEIEDNGPGVPEAIKEKMMLPFFTTKKGSDGTGLGLSISQDIIKDHDGYLEIETKEGMYTRFTIFLNRKN